MHVTRLLRSVLPRNGSSSAKNITGFTIEGFRAATKKPSYDPWERAEAWRHEGQFSRRNRFKGSLPGLYTGTVAFAVYCGYEYLFVNDEHHGHAEGGGKEHH